MGWAPLFVQSVTFNFIFLEEFRLVLCSCFWCRIRQCQGGVRVVLVCVVWVLESSIGAKFNSKIEVGAANAVGAKSD